MLEEASHSYVGALERRGVSSLCSLWLDGHMWRDLGTGILCMAFRRALQAIQYTDKKAKIAGWYNEFAV